MSKNFPFIILKYLIRKIKALFSVILTNGKFELHRSSNAVDSNIEWQQILLQFSPKRILIINPKTA